MICVSQTRRFQCARIPVDCASDLLLATQGHPDSQTSLNYSTAPHAEGEEQQISDVGTLTGSDWTAFCHSGAVAPSTWRLWIGRVASMFSPLRSHVSVRVFICTNSTLERRINKKEDMVKSTRWEQGVAFQSSSPAAENNTCLLLHRCATKTQLHFYQRAHYWVLDLLLDVISRHG